MSSRSVLKAAQTHNVSSPLEASNKLSTDWQRVSLCCRFQQTGMIFNYIMTQNFDFAMRYFELQFIFCHKLMCVNECLVQQEQ